MSLGRGFRFGTLLSLALGWLPLSYGQDSSGLKSSMAVDLTGEFAATADSDAADRFEVRGADIVFTDRSIRTFQGFLASRPIRKMARL